MSGEDVIVSIGIDASAANEGLARSSVKFSGWSRDTERAIAKAEAAGKKLDKSIAALDKPIDHAAASTAKLRAESEKLEKVASLLGPRMGGLVSVMSKFGKTAGSDIGGATLALAGLAAGAGAALYALGSFGSMVLDTIDNVDDLAASLDVVTQKRLKDQIKSLKDTSAALDGAVDSWTELKIVVTDIADGPLADASVVVGAIAKGWALVGENASKAGLDIRAALGPLGSSLMLFEAAANYLTAKDEQLSLGPGGGQIFPMDGSALDGGMSIPPPPGAPAAAKPQPATASTRPRPSTSAAADATMSSMFLPGITIPKSQIDLHAAGLAAVADLDAKFAEDKAARDKAMADAAIEQIEREKAARQAAVQTAIAGASAVTSSLISLGEQAAAAAVENTKEGTAAHREALRDQLTMQELSAVANAALGITNVWSQWAGQPIVAGALTAVELAATGVAIGQIEAQKSKLHTGGLAPDERYGMPQPITRDNERTAVLTREGQRHLDELDRINSGAVQGRNTLQVVVRDESGRGRRMSGREFGRPVPGIGQAPRGVR